MKSLYKMLDKMTDKEMVYRFSIIELYKRGYSIKDAKQMISDSGILNNIEPNDTLWTRDMDEKDWADWIINHAYRYNENKLMIG